MRCEWEGFVAAVNPEESRFLHEFVEKSEVVLSLLPYPKAYERASFVPPSYNATDILTFCSSAVPVGINIPNYDEIRLSKGFKNVSLSNVLPAVMPDQFNFLTDDVLPGFLEDFGDVRKLGIAAHELYGHGSGTLLKEADVVAGIPDLLNPSVNVRTFYAEGETFQQVFGPASSSYEECRAEATSLHLAFKDEVLELFGVPLERRFRFKVNSTLLMLRNALEGLVSYAPEVREWKQAHSRARFAVLRSVLIWGRGSLSVKKVEGKFKLTLDSAKFDGVVDAVELLVKHLNYFKATRLPEQGSEFLGMLTSLDDFWMEVRSQAMAVRTSRPIVCGPTVVKDENGLTFVNPKNPEPTTLDVVLSVTRNVKIASE
jgi:dipeptidyl-peptidase-3